MGARRGRIACNICPTFNIQMVIKEVRGWNNGYKFAYIFSMYLLSFSIWKNFYFTTKENSQVDNQFYFRWDFYIFD